MKPAPYVVYILKCKDGTYYTGTTNNILSRIKKHNNGTGAKYTRGRTPVKLIFTQYYASKSAACAAEWSIKQLSRSQKTKLIRTQKTKIKNQ
ncbi:MAG: GIY-YIG nuclease family protein [Candidatus Omnitrophica bacterium]|nr:GIY-YIG nuclease family protein [Candidatus Omnitrophota bacterium]